MLGGMMCWAEWDDIDMNGDWMNTSCHLERVQSYDHDATRSGASTTVTNDPLKKTIGNCR